jgi:hypothetical protein
VRRSLGSGAGKRVRLRLAAGVGDAVVTEEDRRADPIAVSLQI